MNLKGYIQVNLRHYGANPSPAAYQHHNFDHAIRERYGTSKMSTSNAKSDVDWKIYRASSIPGLSQVKSCLQFLCEDLVDPEPLLCLRCQSLGVNLFFSSGLVCCFNFFSLNRSWAIQSIADFWIRCDDASLRWWEWSWLQYR